MSTLRGFIKQAAIGAAGVAFAGKLAKAWPAAAVFDGMPGSPLSGSGLLAGAGAAEKSKVILVRSKAVVDAAGTVENPLLASMLDKGITTFAGSSSARQHGVK